MEIKNKLTVTRGVGGRGQGRKKREGSSPRTCIKDPWPRTMGAGRGLIVGRTGESNGGKMGTIVIEQQQKFFLIK